MIALFSCGLIFALSGMSSCIQLGDLSVTSICSNMICFGSILWQKSNLFPAIKIKSRFPKKTIIKIPGSYQLVHHLRDLLISDISSHTTIEDLARICSAPWRGTNLKMVAKSLRPFLRESSFDFPAQIGYNRKYLLICKYLGI